MNIFVTGHQSCYELEHVARIFYPTGLLCKKYPSGKPNAVIAHLTAKHMLCAIRQNGLCAIRRVPRPANAGKKEIEYAHARLLFLLLCEATGRKPQWGMLTGVRPVRFVHEMRAKGKDDAEIERFFTQDFFVARPKANMCACIANTQKPIMDASTPRSYSLYISIPFCPSRCSYCSFVSRTIAESGNLTAPYIEALCAELADIAAVAQRNRLRLETIYIGGGTPTAISAPQLRRLMQAVRENFALGEVKEYTVEAGRPDCTDVEKLQIIKEYGATRISINPQTLQNNVLCNIGRKHTAQDILDCYAAARAAGHTNINMDLIAGLPGDTLAGFQYSLSGVIALAPENITVHTLTLKRASNLVIDSAAENYGDVAAMVTQSQKMLAAAGYAPYYLYRQKGTLQNLENTGYTKPGFAGLYNVYIMEEVHTILSAGAGGSTKLVAPGEIERIFNHKYPLEYLKHLDAVHARKKGVDDFYGRFFDLDSKTTG